MASTAAPPDMATLARDTSFGQRELRRMYQRFVAIADDGTRLVSREAFLEQPEGTTCPFLRLALQDALDAALEERNERIKAQAAASMGGAPLPVPRGGLDFAQYVKLYSNFSPKTDPDRKAKFFFAVLDQDSDGFLVQEDLARFFREVYRDTLSDPECELMASTSWSNLFGGKTRVSREEWMFKAAGQKDLMHAVTMYF